MYISAFNKEKERQKKERKIKWFCSFKFHTRSHNGNIKEKKGEERSASGLFSLSTKLSVSRQVDEWLFSPV